MTAAPDFVKRLTPFSECKVKESVQFECVCHAFPAAQITWFHDSDEINDDDLRERFKVEQLDNGIHRLTLNVSLLLVSEGYASYTSIY